jgi:putative transcriptional regulator
LIVLCLPAAVPLAALSKPEVTPHSVSLAGQLLIASPEIGDPRFDHAVILLVRHTNEGALGIVINRPVGERPLASFMEAIGEPGTGVEGSVHIFLGGPVGRGIGMVLHSADYRREKTLDIDERMGLTSPPEILRDIARKRGPQKFLVALGYAGWGPGQLESELAQHGWFTAPSDLHLIFDEDREKVWQTAMARRARDLWMAGTGLAFSPGLEIFFDDLAETNKRIWCSKGTLIARAGITVQ